MNHFLPGGGENEIFIFIRSRMRAEEEVGHEATTYPSASGDGEYQIHALSTHTNLNARCTDARIRQNHGSPKTGRETGKLGV